MASFAPGHFIGEFGTCPPNGPAASKLKKKKEKKRKTRANLRPRHVDRQYSRLRPISFLAAVFPMRQRLHWLSLSGDVLNRVPTYTLMLMHEQARRYFSLHIFWGASQPATPRPHNPPLMCDAARSSQGLTQVPVCCRFQPFLVDARRLALALDPLILFMSRS